MNEFENRLPGDHEAVERRLREEKRVAGAPELDELKLRAMKQAQRTTSKGVPVRARLVTAILTLALIGGGGGAVIAASGGGSATGDEGAANSQYCPPKSPGGDPPPKPKNPPPGNKCGQP